MIKGMKKIYLSLIILFLYAPIIVLVIFSFNESKNRNVWTGFSLKWYAELFRDRDILSALKYTFIIAIIAAVVSTLIGTLASIGMFRLKKFSFNLVKNVTYIPVLNPDIVTGISLMLLFVFLQFEMGFVTMLLSHITFCIPYVILSVLPKLKQTDISVYEAAQDLGATPMTALWKVVIPEIRPGIVTGFLLAFTLSVDDFVISYFTSGNGVENLSMVVFSMARKGINPTINALSTLLFVLVMSLLLVINKKNKESLF
ncbi:MAG: ABC transporter permease [Clostridia bacterium]|nr:ABC transporter permease [Clostridia bacterium]